MCGDEWRADKASTAGWQQISPACDPVWGATAQGLSDSSITMTDSSKVELHSSINCPLLANDLQMR